MANDKCVWSLLFADTQIVRVSERMRRAILICLNNLKKLLIFFGEYSIIYIEQSRAKHA